MPNLIAVNESIPTAGAIVWWRLKGAVDGAKLAEAWKAANLPEEHLPTAPSLDRLLRRALKVVGEAHVLVRPLPNGAGWALVRENPTDALRLTYIQEATVNLFAETVVVEPKDHHMAPVIEEEFARVRAELSQSDVSKWLVDRVEGLGAVSLRDTGGIYFLPRPALAVWHLMVEAIRASSSNGMFEVPALRSDEAVAAVLDALSREAEKEAAEMEAELAAEELGEKALQTRVARCERMVTKVEQYETLMGQSMAALKERLDNLRVSMATAVLMPGKEFVA